MPGRKRPPQGQVPWARAGHASVRHASEAHIDRGVGGHAWCVAFRAWLRSLVYEALFRSQRLFSATRMYSKVYTIEHAKSCRGVLLTDASRRVRTRQHGHGRAICHPPAATRRCRGPREGNDVGDIWATLGTRGGENESVGSRNKRPKQAFCCRSCEAE